jgi:uncharacterized protein (DUF342 family)
MEKSLENLIKSLLGAKKPHAGTPQDAERVDIDGAAWVRGGKIFVRDPVGSGRRPVIVPVPEVQLFVNGHEVSEPTEVQASDDIAVVPRIRELPGRLTIRVAPDRLTASAELVPRRVIRYRLVDREPTPDLMLEVTGEEELHCPLSYEEILTRLVEQGVTHGLNYAEIRRLVEQPREGCWTVAEGEPPKPPEDEWLEVPWLKETEYGPKDPVDFRDFRRIPSVEPGDLLAVKRPGTPGHPGVGVDGQPLLPPAPRQLVLKAGFGARLQADGLTAVATVAGRPAVEEYGNVRVVRVEPVLVHEGDVDMTTGNIRFKGNVKIIGNVQDGMTVQASGTVEILGMVSGAYVGAGGSVIAIRENVVSSVIQAGPPARWQDIAALLEELHTQLGQLYQAAHVLFNHPEVRRRGTRYGHVILLPLEIKFPEIRERLHRLKSMLDRERVPAPPETELLWQKLKGLCGLEAVKVTENFLTDLLEEVAANAAHLRSLQDKPTDVVLQYAANSKIEATGKVLITGQGCFNTHIRAGGDVDINGVFRGGEIVAGGRVSVREAGSEVGARTTIRVPEDRTIKIGKAYENVLLQIGGRSTLLSRLCLALEARLDQQGRLNVNALPLEPDDG